MRRANFSIQQFQRGEKINESFCSISFYDNKSRVPRPASIHAISFFFYLFPWFRGKGTKLLELLIDYFHRVCIYSRIKKKKERKKNVRARDYHSMQKIGGRQKVGASSWFLAVGQGSIAIPHSGLPGDLETRWKGEEKRRKRSAPSVTLVSISRNRVYRKETSPGRV